jgi:hypothetical protein
MVCIASWFATLSLLAGGGDPHCRPMARAHVARSVRHGGEAWSVLCPCYEPGDGP